MTAENSTDSVASAPVTENPLHMMEVTSEDISFQPEKNKHNQVESKLSWKEISEIVDRVMFYIMLAFTLCIYLVFV